MTQQVQDHKEIVTGMYHWLELVAETNHWPTRLKSILTNSGHEARALAYP
jgi:hypothetical protein